MRQLENTKELDLIWENDSLQDYFSFPIRPYTAVVEFEPEELILGKNEKPERLFYLFEGRAKVFLADEHGRISPIDFVESPSFLGELEWIGARERAQCVCALTRCRCFSISLSECQEAMLQDVRFLQKLCLFLGNKTRRMSENYVRNQSYPLMNRLATFILLTMHHGTYTEKHTEAAEYLGVTYRHLLYVLADFRKRGILEKTPQGYRVRDMEALEELRIIG
ncbi:MAG: transcriptional regulator YeiL [Lachnospiraceae bacterium]|nr:transcriptional regulator YeiL [Lachnospiraceae bacterium]MCI8997364.1 transcriptional regulator YeiL [Lachnospiraceae bacterium]MCI9132786.1 transcriptional regulator YeiL [Lachnospiraceae bacterium]